MNIAVMGAGAVGCYFGGMLARAGHDVVLIARPQHVRSIQEKGLLLETTSFTEAVALRASSDAAAIQGADCVLFCVKSTDTLDAARQIAPHLGEDTLVLSLQNGVDNAQRAQTVLAQSVIPAVVYVATEMAGAGHVKHHGRGELLIGPSPGSQALAATFSQSGVPVQVSDNVAGALWNKLIINCAYNALSAITQLPYGRLVQGEGMVEVMRTAVDEAMAVAQGLGIALPGDVWQQVQAIAHSMATQSSSTAQDLLLGRPSEIDFLNGYVAREGTRLGLATPVNHTLLALVKTLQDKRDARL